MTVSSLIGRIRKRREALNYSQEYLAAKLCISQKTYSKLELQHNKLTVERLLQICDVLEVDIKDLLQHDGYVAMRAPV